MQELDFTSLRTCKNIGLYDSGVGGLSVLRKLANLDGAPPNVSQEAVKSHKARQFLYLGDNARCPYGDRNSTEIVTFATEIISWLTASGADAIVMACNTSAASALEIARKSFNVPIFDLIAPTARKVSQLGVRVGVMATASTIRTRAFSKAIHSYAPHIQITELACPDLVPLVEAGRITEAYTVTLLQGYVDRLLRDGVEALVLGCTHFPFFSEVLEGLVRGRMLIIDPAEVIASLFLENDAPVYSNDACKLFVTGDAFSFGQTAEICLGYNLGTISSINLTEVVGSTVGSTLLDPVY